MDWDVVPARDDRAYLETDLLAWPARPPDVDVETWLAPLPREHRHAVRWPAGMPPTHAAQPVAYAGAYGVLPLTLTVPGPLGATRQIEVAGLTSVGVHPDLRRRGVLGAMMRHHLDRVPATWPSGVSCLHASEPTIYGRFGYGVATVTGHVSAPRETALTAPALDAAASDVTTHLLTLTAQGVPERLSEVSAQLGRRVMGHLVRRPELYRHMGVESEQGTQDTEPRRVLLARRAGADVGYAICRRRLRWSDGVADGTTEVAEVVGEPATRLALWRRLLSLDLMARTTATIGGADDPLVSWMGDRRVASVRLVDGMWVRLVDLPAALRARGYACAVDVVLEVQDRDRPDQAGRWRLQVDEGGEAHPLRTDREPDLTLDVGELGRLYLGRGGLVARVHAGVVAEHSVGAAARLDDAMRSAVPSVAALFF